MIRDIVANMKKNAYNLMAKLDLFGQIYLESKNQNDKLSLTTIGGWSRRFTEIHIPLYENFKGEIDMSKIPYIEQLSEKLETEMFNGE